MLTEASVQAAQDIEAAIKQAAVGSVPENWNVRSVGQLVADGVLAKIQDGNHGEIHPVSADYVPSGVPFIMSGDIRHGRVNVHQCKFLIPEQARSLRVGHAKKGDVLLTHKRNDLGRSGILRDADYAILTPQVTYYRVLAPEVIKPEFLRWIFESPRFQHQFKRDAQQSTRPFVSITNQQRLHLPIPPIREQETIAAVLGALDDKIELNRQMNTTLEAMARALFQSWFVDFDPVRAKQEGRPPASLDEPTAALFPARFQESPLGEIPDGWEVRNLNEIANYLNGLALQKFPPREEPTLPVIKIAQLRKGDSQGADRCNTDVPPEYVVADGDVLFSWSGSLEVELWCGGTGALNQHLFKVTSARYPKWFYYLWTLHHLDDFRRIAASKATTMGHIQRKHLAAAFALVPPTKLLDAMTKMMTPLVELIIVNRVQSRSIAAIRNILLPGLLGGELSVNKQNLPTC